MVYRDTCSRPARRYEFARAVAAADTIHHRLRYARLDEDAGSRESPSPSRPARSVSRHHLPQVRDLSV
jgi:hypothetical protein